MESMHRVALALDGMYGLKMAPQSRKRRIESFRHLHQDRYLPLTHNLHTQHPVSISCLIRSYLIGAPSHRHFFPKNPLLPLATSLTGVSYHSSLASLCTSTSTLAIG